MTRNFSQQSIRQKKYKKMNTATDMIRFRQLGLYGSTGISAILSFIGGMVEKSQSKQKYWLASSANWVLLLLALVFSVTHIQKLMNQQRTTKDIMLMVVLIAFLSVQIYSVTLFLGKKKQIQKPSPELYELLSTHNLFTFLTPIAVGLLGPILIGVQSTPNVMIIGGILFTITVIGTGITTGMIYDHINNHITDDV